MKLIRLSTAAALATAFCVVPLAAATVSVPVAEDVQMVEPSNNFSNGTQLNTRNSAATNDLIALKFNLSAYDLSASSVDAASLSLTGFRLDGSNRTVLIYGVKHGTAASQNGTGGVPLTTETWTESNLTTWGSMPGLLTTDGTATEASGSMTGALTNSRDTANIEFLGSLTIPANSIAEGSPVVFSFPAITAFLETYAGDNVTFLLAGGTTSTGQFRAASGETTSTATLAQNQPAGTYAPVLAFDYTPVPEPGVLSLAFLTGAGLILRRRPAR